MKKLGTPLLIALLAVCLFAGCEMPTAERTPDKPTPPVKPKLSIADTSVTEGDSGASNAVFSVTLNTAGAETATVSYATADGTATAGTDYQAASGTLTFAAGNRSQRITVVVNGDTVDEDDETHGNAQQPVSDARRRRGDGHDHRRRRSGDQAGSADASRRQRCEQCGVQRDAPGPRRRRFHATADGTAVGTDYQAASGTLTFAAGNTSQRVTVVVNGDTEDEDDETFTITLRNPSQATLADAMATGTIIDDDASPEMFRDCPDCPELVVVPAGSFTMGSPSSEVGRDEDEVQAPVTIGAPFAVGVHEVTVAQWDSCVAAGGCARYRPADQGWGRGTQPVINVSWDDAQQYVAWLSTKTGHQYRLLTEAEWEYVARADTTTPFHTGATISTDQANYDGLSTPYGSGQMGEYRARTIAAGSFPANDFGLYDVHGNAAEWVEDCYDADAGERHLQSPYSTRRLLGQQPAPPALRLPRLVCPHSPQQPKRVPRRPHHYLTLIARRDADR